MDENNNKKSKLKMALIIILIIVLIIALGFSGIVIYYKHFEKIENDKISEIYSKNENALINTEVTETVEYGSEITYNQLTDKLVNLDDVDQHTEVKVLINGDEFEKNTSYRFDKIGTYTVKCILSRQYSYKILAIESNKIIENGKEIKIIVEDTKMPIMEGVSDKEVTVGDTIDLLDGIKATDEIDGELEVTIEGDFDINKIGVYTLKATAKDKNENVVEQDFKVTVMEKKIEQPKTSTSAKTSSNTTTTTNNNKTSTNTPSTNTTTTSTPTSSDPTSTQSGRLNLAKAEAKRVVSQIITPGMTDYDKANAIFRYLHSNVSLQTNQSNEAYKENYGNEAYAALVLKKAACSGFCKAVTLMCNEAGLQSQHINANQWTHQWNTVYVNGEWIILDAQAGIFGGTSHPLEN